MWKVLKTSLTYKYRPIMKNPTNVRFLVLIPCRKEETTRDTTKSSFTKIVYFGHKILSPS